MKTLSIICSLANTSDDKSSKNIHQPINIMYNSLYMLNLSHKKTKAIARLDVHIYKAYECKHINEHKYMYICTWIQTYIHVFVCVHCVLFCVFEAKSNTTRNTAPMRRCFSR